VTSSCGIRFCDDDGGDKEGRVVVSDDDDDDDGGLCGILTTEVWALENVFGIPRLVCGPLRVGLWAGR